MVMFLLALLLPLEPGNYYFTADWCSSCIRQSKVIKELEAEGHKFVTFDYDKDPKAFEANKVNSMPTIIIIKNGKIRKLKGFQSVKKLRRLL